MNSVGLVDWEPVDSVVGLVGGELVDSVVGLVGGELVGRVGNETVAEPVLVGSVEPVPSVEGVSVTCAVEEHVRTALGSEQQEYEFHSKPRGVCHTSKAKGMLTPWGSVFLVSVGVVAVHRRMLE